MARDDLLALSVDDLVTLTNRGIVKRALREIEAGEPTCTFEEEGDELRVTWSDGTLCRFPAGAAFEDSICSSGATGVSRHVVRSVLAFQRSKSDVDAESEPDVEASTEESSPDEQGADDEVSSRESSADATWDPGAITDDDLVKAYGKAAVTRARTAFSKGVVAELVRGTKPSARFLHDPCVVRFLVPNDLRYVHADCEANALPTFAALAVWSFRELAAEREAGLVTIGTVDAAVPSDLLADLDEAIDELAEHGLSGCGAAWRDRLTRLEERCRTAGLTWPADVAGELGIEFDRYTSHDALFDPAVVLELVGELLVRVRAIRSDTGAVPQLLVRGTTSDRPRAIRSCRFVGLGSHVALGRTTTRLTTFHQDAVSGTVLGVSHEFGDGDEPREFAELARISVRRGLTVRAMASGMLLLKSAKRTASHRLVLPRGHLTANPQSFEWEKLRSPVLVDGFSEVEERLAALPPRSLRPRRITEDLHVLPIDSADEPTFDVAVQKLQVRLTDVRGRSAVLQHPFTSRGRHGFESLLRELDGRKRLRFVAGRVKRTHAGLVVHPSCCVFESRGNRTAIQPWADGTAGDSAAVDDQSGDETESPVDMVRTAFAADLADVLHVGLRSLDRAAVEALRSHAERLESVGFAELPRRVHSMHAAVDQRHQQRRWEPTTAVNELKGVLVWSHLLADAT